MRQLGSGILLPIESDSGHLYFAWIEIAPGGEEIDYQVAINHSDQYEIWDPSGSLIPNLHPPIATAESGGAAAIAGRLVHLAKYHAILQLSNCDQTSPLARKLVIQLKGRQEDYDPADQPAPKPLGSPGRTPLLKSGEWTFLSIKNDSDQPLNIALLDLQPDWGVSQIFPSGKGDSFEVLEPGRQRLLPLQASLPEGLEEGTDILKVFATVRATQFRRLELPRLGRPLPHGAEFNERSFEDPLEDLLRAIAAQRPPTRNLTAAAHPSFEWTTAQVRIDVRRQSMQPNGQQIEMSGRFRPAARHRLASAAKIVPPVPPRGDDGMDLLDELRWRQVLYDHTEGLPEALADGPLTAYIGFDPTAASLHVGTLLPILGLARLQRAGHSPIALVGGGTGLIGDPSGKTHERQLLSKEQAEENAQGIRRQLSRFLDFEARANPARMVNNLDWLAKLPLVDFLRDVGKHFTVNAMLAKESVKRRLGQEEGISYTEFSYMLMQSYDYLVLHDEYGCRLQMGGSDQWGNITSGIELIRRMRSHRAYGLVFPLVASSSGVKFGKTEAGTVWLDPAMTSPYRFYQFWLNTDDRDAATYLKYFTWLRREEIEELESALQQAPEKREAQRRLALEVTRMLHGETECSRAVKASEVLFGGEIEGLTGLEVEDIFSEVPSSELPAERLDGGVALTEVLTQSGLASSKGDARRLIQGGGIYLNNRRVTDVRAQAERSDCIEGRFLVLRKGSKNYHLVRALQRVSRKAAKPQRKNAK